MNIDSNIVITLSAIALHALYRVLLRIHNRDTLENGDVAVVSLSLLLGMLNNNLMRLLCMSVITYGAATWLCRWIVARAREEDEDADSDMDADSDTDVEPETICGYAVTPPRKGSYVESSTDHTQVESGPVQTQPTTDHVSAAEIAAESERAIVDAFSGTSYNPND